MQRITLKGLSTAALAAAAIAFAPVSAFAEVERLAAMKNADTANGEKIFKEGKGSVPACNSCHGMSGMGDDAMGTPRLAGQGFMYLLKQLEDFATDKRTDTTMFIMNANAKGLSEQDRRDVSAFLYNMKGEPEPSSMDQVKELGQPVGTRHKGKALVHFGAPERDIPACRACHQFNGRGAYPFYPMLAGQKYVYLVNQLKQWRDGSRANDSKDQMQKVARNMTDQDIYNVASFLTSAPLTTMGNDYVYEQMPH